VEVIDKRTGKTTTSRPIKVTVNIIYNIIIDISGNVLGDIVTASPDSGIAGDTVTFTYTVANTMPKNLLNFDGVNATINPVNNAGNGTRTYVINAGGRFREDYYHYRRI
ncbi:hypothetical protein, partial [Treponema sp. R6D11]